jgi:hypothetical protein
MSRRIAEELSQEFARQAELERAAGLPITVMVAHNDAEKAKMEVSPRCGEQCAWLRPHAYATQLGFLKFVVQPLYQKLAVVCPGFGPHCLALIASNKKMWETVIAKADAAAAALAASQPPPPPTERRSLNLGARPKMA